MQKSDGNILFGYFNIKKVHLIEHCSVTSILKYGLKNEYTRVLKKIHTNDCNVVSYSNKNKFFMYKKKTKSGVKRDIHKTTKKEKFRYLPNFFLYVCLIFCFNRPYKLLVIRSKKKPTWKEWMNYKLTKTASMLFYY